LSSRATCAPKTLALAVAAVFAVAVGVAAYAANVWPRIENESVDLRFSFHGATRPPDDVAVVAIDAKTFSDLHLQWPFPRRLHAAMIERLHADGASTIVYDIQFTEPSRLGPGDDLALYHEIGRAGKVVLATSEVDARDQTDVLGGEANLRRVHAIAAASNLPADAGGVIRRYPYSMLGLKGLALTAAETDGHAVMRSRFNDGSAWIDFRGPPGTINTVPFSDVLRGRVAPRTFSGKIVVVGAAAPTLQDVHPTSTASAAPMTGAEIQASAIWTALHGNPLQAAPAWLALLAILLGGAVAPLASLRLRVVFSTLIAAALAGTYLVLAQLAFDSGTILVLTYPLATLALGIISMVAAN